MRVLIVGIGDAFTARFFGTSAVIEGPDGHLLIDCPDLVHRAVRVASETAGWPLDTSMIDDVILTHLHGDHCNGLESFGFKRRLAGLTGPARRPRLYTVPEVAARLWERLAPAMDAPFAGAEHSTLEDYFDVRLMTAGVPISIAGLDVACRMTRHVIPTIGLRIADDRGELGWSGDTPFDEEHLRWLAEADIIVHEANEGPYHTDLAKLEALAPALREKIRLVHLPDGFDRGSTGIDVLAEGEVLEVQRKRG